MILQALDEIESREAYSSYEADYEPDDAYALDVAELDNAGVFDPPQKLRAKREENAQTIEGLDAEIDALNRRAAEFDPEVARRELRKQVKVAGDCWVAEDEIDVAAVPLVDKLRELHATKLEQLAAHHAAAFAVQQQNLLAAAQDDELAEQWNQVADPKPGTSQPGNYSFGRFLADAAPLDVIEKSGALPGSFERTGAQIGAALGSSAGFTE